jgi:hypothetical protein
VANQTSWPDLHQHYTNELRLRRAPRARAAMPVDRRRG